VCYRVQGLPTAFTLPVVKRSRQSREQRTTIPKSSYPKSMALGAGSVASLVNTVSVGAPGNERAHHQCRSRRRHDRCRPTGCRRRSSTTTVACLLYPRLRPYCRTAARLMRSHRVLPRPHVIPLSQPTEYAMVMEGLASTTDLDLDRVRFRRRAFTILPWADFPPLLFKHHAGRGPVGGPVARRGLTSASGLAGPSSLEPRTDASRPATSPP
jgi:hypothetical protein